MNRITIITRMRALAAIAPAILLLVGIAIAGAFYVFGATPELIYETQYMSARAADGMEASLFKMDWGRYQPDGGQIVMDQQRRFVSWVDLARSRADSQAQLDRVQKIAEASGPVFDAMRKSGPGDDSVEPSLRSLEGLVSDLSSAQEASMLAVAARVEASARIMIVLTIAAVIIVPWVCFVLLYRASGLAGAELREIRRNFTLLHDRGGAAAPELSAIDECLARLGFPKPNPMLAEE
jgi:hypothetical protein